MTASDCSGQQKSCCHGRRMRAALLRRMGPLSGKTNGAEIRQATTLEELVAAYKLTHDTFVDQGFIEPHPSGLRLRPHEALLDTATFIAVAEGDVVGVTTAVYDTEIFGLPSDGAFQAEIDELRSQGRHVGEGTNWLLRPEFRRTGVLGELVRVGTAHAFLMGCTDILGAVNASHAGFYESIGYEVIGSERSYSKEHYDPVILVRLDLLNLEQHFAGPDYDFLMSYWVNDNPYRQVIGEWSRRAKAVFSDPALLKALFHDRGQFLQSCHGLQLEGIRRYWGLRRFEAVLDLIAEDVRVLAGTGI